MDGGTHGISSRLGSDSEMYSEKSNEGIDGGTGSSGIGGIGGNHRMRFRSGRDMEINKEKLKDGIPGNSGSAGIGIEGISHGTSDRFGNAQFVKIFRQCLFRIHLRFRIQRLHSEQFRPGTPILLHWL